MNEEKENIISSLITRMKDDKKFELRVYVIIVIAALAIYVLWSNFIGNNSKESQNSKLQDTVSVTSDDKEAERKLANVLSNIKGAGKVEVMITYETGVEIVPAMSTDKRIDSSNDNIGTKSSETEVSSPATVSKNGSNEPVVLTEIQPKVRGVIVVAEGAYDIGVRIDLMNAVETVLGISPDCIEVFEMQKN